MSKGGGDVKETDEQKQMAKVARSRWDDYQTMFRPYEDKYFGKVEGLNSESQMRDVAGLADRAVGSSFSQAVTGTAKEMSSRGVNPNSGLFQAELNKLEQRKAKQRNNVTNKAQVSQQDRFVGGLQSIAQMGQGQAVDAIMGLSDVAGQANRYAANEANISMQRRRGNQELVGAVAGAGVRYGLNPAPSSASATNPNYNFDTQPAIENYDDRNYMGMGS